MLEEHNYISPGDEELCTITDDLNEAVGIIKQALADQHRRAALQAVGGHARPTAEGTLMGMPVAGSQVARKRRAERTRRKR
jgi:hypothetical protein